MQQVANGVSLVKAELDKAGHHRVDSALLYCLVNRQGGFWVCLTQFSLEIVSGRAGVDDRSENPDKRSKGFIFWALVKVSDFWTERA